MMNTQGDFIWYELMTLDAGKAAAFYKTVIGWQIADSGQPNKDYRICSAHDENDGADHPVAGIFQLEGECAQTAIPGWYGYLAVDNVDAKVASIVAAGGEVYMPATDLPDVGRMAMVTDPQGMPFYIMRGSSKEPSFAFAHDRPRIGHCAWNELITNDPKSALAFYSEQFGWQKDGEMDMGEMGAYEFVRHGSVIGAMMRKPPEMPNPQWNFYFRVADIDHALKLAKDAGAEITLEPSEVPGGDFIIQGIDPTGACFALVGQRKSSKE